MNKNNIVELMTHKNSILVVLYTGTKLVACIAKQVKKQIQTGTIVESLIIDNSLAIAELKEKLIAKGEVIPQKAILGSIEVVNGMVDIPVVPEKPRDHAQMQELIHWEIDPFLSELNDITTIGSLLQSRQYITAEQRDDIVSQMNSLNEQGDRTRFGEMALQLSLISREALDEVLGLQEHLISHDEQIVCGWNGASVKNDEGELNHYWNVSGLGKHRRNHWTHSFKTQQLKLIGLLPLYGSSLRHVLRTYQLEAKEALIVEVFQEQIFSYRVKQGRIVSIRIERRLDPLLNESIFVSLCYDQLRANIEQIDIVSDELIDHSIIVQIEAQLQRKVRLSKTESQPWLAWLNGLADSALDKKWALAKLPMIAANDPKPAFWKQANTWRYSAPVLILISLIVFDISQRIYLSSLESKLVELETKFDKAGKVSTQHGKINSLLRTAQQQYEEKKLALDKITIEYDRLNDQLYSRVNNLPNLLRSIASSVNGNIALNSINEYNKKSGVRIIGTTLSNRDAQRFVKRLNNNVAKQNLVASYVQVEQSSKRIGQEGYTFNLWLLEKNKQEKNGIETRVDTKEVAKK